MSQPVRLILCSVAALATVAALAPSRAQTAPAAPPAFAACRACHVVKKDAKSGLGPNLFGVVGRPAGSAVGFNYSPALKASKLKWDDATLDAYLASPMKKVPGSRMPIATPDPAKRAAIIAYLKAAK